MISITLMYKNKVLQKEKFDRNDSPLKVISFLLENYKEHFQISDPQCYKIHSKYYNGQINPYQSLYQQLGRISADTFRIELDQKFFELQSTSSQTNQGQKSEIFISQFDQQQIQVPQGENYNQQLIQSQVLFGTDENEFQNYLQELNNSASMIQNQNDMELLAPQQILNLQQNLIKLKIKHLQQEFEFEIPIEFKLKELKEEIKIIFEISEPFQMIQNNQNLLNNDQELSLDQLQIQNKSEINIVVNTQQSVIYFLN